MPTENALEVDMEMMFNADRSPLPTWKEKTNAAWPQTMMHDGTAGKTCFCYFFV